MKIERAGYPEVITFGALPAVSDLEIHALDAQPGIGIIRILGAIDASNTSKLKASFEEFGRRKIHRLVVSLKQAKFIASSGFSQFLAARDTVSRSGGRLVFASTPDPIREVFLLLGFEGLVDFAQDERSAIALLSPVQEK